MGLNLNRFAYRPMPPPQWDASLDAGRRSGQEALRAGSLDASASQARQPLPRSQILLR
jgi:hypothetical protein